MNKSVRTALKSETAVANRALIAFDRIADGGFAEVSATIEDDAESLILYREGNTVRAWFNICPHTGRRLDWAPGRFLTSQDGLLVCAKRWASFELGRGECVGGPCRGASLRAVGVEVRDGWVWLSTKAA